MRIAAIYDIHGNLPALEAVLKVILKSGLDQIVVGGDVVPGPMPLQTLACLSDLKVPVQFIQGNGEVAVLAQMEGKNPGPLPEQVLEIIRWTAKQLLPEHKQLLSAWPKTLRLAIEALGEVLFCHATPRNENEIFTRLTSEDTLLPIFEKANADIVVCGHTHMQFDRMIGRVRVINAGSVGMPFGKPGAYWLLLGTNIELRYTSYDLTKAAELIRDTTYPQAEDFASNTVLQPPSEAKMVEAFNRVELK
ncbi:MAG: metallophosphoesterase family protein [Chitinophagales bacterium]|nr:metallophosphoesterase family protein [Chitinophagales bacterium]